MAVSPRLQRAIIEYGPQRRWHSWHRNHRCIHVRFWSLGCHRYAVVSHAHKTCVATTRHRGRSHLALQLCIADHRDLGCCQPYFIPSHFFKRVNPRPNPNPRAPTLQFVITLYCYNSETHSGGDDCLSFTGVSTWRVGWCPIRTRNSRNEMRQGRRFSHCKEGRL